MPKRPSTPSKRALLFLSCSPRRLQRSSESKSKLKKKILKTRICKILIHWLRSSVSFCPLPARHTSSTLETTGVSGGGGGRRKKTFECCMCLTSYTFDYFGKQPPYVDRLVYVLVSKGNTHSRMQTAGGGLHDQGPVCDKRQASVPWIALRPV